MVGQVPAPPCLETDWLLGQFGPERSRARAAYGAFVRQGVGQPSVWEGLQHQVFLGSEAFVERLGVSSNHQERLREVPRAQRRSFSKPLTHFAHRYPRRHEAMARAYQTGVYTMREIADHFGVHYSTVSRAVRRLQSENGSSRGVPAKPKDA